MNFRLPLCFFVFLVGAACNRDVSGDKIVDQSFSFPVSIAVSAGDNVRYAYVLSSNFDQRYTSGWISVIDLQCMLYYLGKFDHDGALNTTFAGQCGAREDADSNTILLQSIGQQLPVPNLGGHVVIAPDNSYLLTSFRGTARLGLVPISDGGRSLQCINEDGALSGSCGTDGMMGLNVDAINASNGITDANKGTTTSPIVTLTAITDPFSMTFFDVPATGSDGARTMAAVTYLSSGWLSLFDVARSDTDGSDTTPALPVLTHRRSVLLGATGVGAVALRPASSADPNDPNATAMDDGRPYLVAVSQRINSTDPISTSVYTVDVGRALAGAPFSDGHAVQTMGLGATSGGAESASLAFSQDGQRAYVANLSTGTTVGALSVLDNRIVVRQETDAAANVTGLHPWPRFQPLGGAGLVGRPMGMVQINKSTGRYVLVAAYDDNAIDVFVEQGDQLQWLHRMDNVGEGPFWMTRARVQGYDLILVTTFFDHSVVVLDVTGATPSTFSILTRIRNEEVPRTPRPHF